MESASAAGSPTRMPAAVVCQRATVPNSLGYYAALLVPSGWSNWQFILLLCPESHPQAGYMRTPNNCAQNSFTCTHVCACRTAVLEVCSHALCVCMPNAAQNTCTRRAHARRGRRGVRLRAMRALSRAHAGCVAEPVVAYRRSCRRSETRSASACRGLHKPAMQRAPLE